MLAVGAFVFVLAGHVWAQEPPATQPPPPPTAVASGPNEVAAQPVAEQASDTGLRVMVEPVGGGLFLIDKGTSVGSGSWGVNLSLGWRLASYFHVGVRQSLNFGLVETCFYDGEYGLGRGEMCPSMYEPSGAYLVALLGTRLLLGFDLGDHVAMRPTFGIGMYGTKVTPSFTWIPFPSAGLDVDVAVYRSEAIDVRLGAGLVVHPALTQGVFLLPQAGVSLEF